MSNSMSLIKLGNTPLPAIRGVLHNTSRKKKHFHGVVAATDGDQNHAQISLERVEEAAGHYQFCQ